MPDTARCAARFAAGHSLLLPMLHRPMLATGNQCGNLFLTHPADCSANNARFIGARISGYASDFGV